MSIRFHCRCGQKFVLPDKVAGRKAKCNDCGREFIVPIPAKKRPKSRPGPKTGMDALAVTDDPQQDAPPAPPARRQGSVKAAEAARPHSAAARRAARRGGKAHSAGAVRMAAGLAVGAILLVALDVFVVLAIGMQGGARREALIHAVWLPALVLSFFVAAAAAKGSRLCMGILLGGAVRGMFVNGPWLLIWAANHKDAISEIRTPVAIAGWIALSLGAVYLLLLLVSREARKLISGHQATVFGGAAAGLLLGGIVAATALPGPLLMYSRAQVRPKAEAEAPAAPDPQAAGPGASAPGATSPTSPGSPAGPAKPTDAAAEQQKLRVRQIVAGNMIQIAKALGAYMDSHRYYMPADLGALVSGDCPAENFICPGSGKAVPQVDRAGGKFTGAIDVTYLFPRYHRFDYDAEDNQNEMQVLVVCHSDPACHGGEGAVVLHPPMPGPDYRTVEKVDKDTLETMLQDTRRWLDAHPPRKPLDIQP